MKEQAKISVIVPVYNTSNYLGKCLNSIIGQTWENIEVICVDDGSTDDSGKICDQYACRDKRIKVIHQPNEGLVRTRKKGLAEAAGKLIAYVDGDDWIEPDMLEKLYSVLAQKQVSIAMCGRYEDTGDAARPVYQGIEAGRYDKKDLMEKVYPRMIVNGRFFEWGIFPGVWDKLFRRECLEQFQMMVDDSLSMGEDAACTYPCLLNADSIYIMHECLYHYRQNAASIVHQSEACEVERKRFKILYDSVSAALTQYKNIYDLTGQWTEYLLFLMVPRADTLYRGIEDLDYLFPFPKVRKGSRIVIYGMGVYGQRLYRYLMRTQFCEVAACADRNYVALSGQGWPVMAPDEIGRYECDAVVVACSFAGTREAVYRELIRIMPEEKVHLMDEALVKSRESLRAFGLI